MVKMALTSSGTVQTLENLSYQSGKQILTRYFEKITKKDETRPNGDRF
jgi:hypothetical protein